MPVAGPIVVGLDGGYVRSRHPQEERHFEVIAGKVIDADGVQHRFAFTRNGQAASAEAFQQALAAAGVSANTPATVLCDGDAGLWRLQREVLPDATPVLDWWHVAVRFEHALQTTRPRCGHGQRSPRRWGGPHPRTGEVASVARPLAGVPTQAGGSAPLDGAPAGV